jgi:hypothetical protein
VKPPVRREGYYAVCRFLVKSKAWQKASKGLALGAPQLQKLEAK